MTRLLDPYVIHVLDQGKPRRFLEGSAKMGGTYMESAGEFL